MKITTATIADVEVALAAFKAAAQLDQSLEHDSKKKLAAAVDALTPKDGVTKDLNQAFTYGENWWAKSVLNDNADGCTKENKLEKIKLHVLKSPSYLRHSADENTRAKVARWLADTFPVTADAQDEAA